MMLYRLSKVIPVRFRSRYLTGPDGGMHAERATWWQWRDHVFFHRTVHGW